MLFEDTVRSEHCSRKRIQATSPFASHPPTTLWTDPVTLLAFRSSHFKLNGIILSQFFSSVNPFFEKNEKIFKSPIILNATMYIHGKRCIFIKNTININAFFSMNSTKALDKYHQTCYNTSDIFTHSKYKITVKERT